MDLWLRAKSLAEEATKKTHDLTKEATKLSQGFASETAKKSREFAVEATKRADLIKAEAIKRADQIKTLTDGISPQIPSLSLPASLPSLSLPASLPSLSLPTSSSAPEPEPEDLQKYGVTDDLREFVKGLTLSTFGDFPDDEPQPSDVPTISNVRQDLTEFQARHATLVLSTVKEISHFRYELCPRHMKEHHFWKIYFTLVKNHVAPYEMAAIDEAKLKSIEKKDVGPQETHPTEVSPKLEPSQPVPQQKKPAEDIDAFLLGDLGSSDDEPVSGGADGGLDDDDDDFDKIVSVPSSKRP